MKLTATLSQEVENSKIDQDSVLEEEQQNQTNIIIMGVGTANSSVQSVHQSDLTDLEDISKNETCVLSESNTHSEMCKTVTEESPSLRIIHERTSSHCEISPEYRTSSEEDVSQEIYSRRRPWSHVYGDVEAERIFNPPSIRDTAPSFWRRMSISGGSQPTLIAEEPPPSREVSSGLLSRYFTLRTSTPQLSSVDSVLERFRKSFNFRFQKSKNKQTDVSTPDIRNQEYITPCNSHEDYVCRDLSTSTCSKKSPKKSGANKENVKVGFRIGSLILRSSREGKKNKKFNEELNNKMDNIDSKNKVNPSVYQNSNAVLKEELSPTPNIKEENHLSEAVKNLTESNPTLSHPNDMSVRKDMKQNYGMEQSIMLLTPHNTPTTEQASFPSPINLCALHLQLLLHHYRGIARLRRSISQPIALETLGSAYKQGTILYGLSEQESQEVSLSSSEEEISSDSELYHSQRSCSWRSGSSCGEYDSEPVDGDILWDHNATDSEEFDLKTTDRMKIAEPSIYRDWWWGSSSNKSGWLSAAYLRLNANKEASDKESHPRPLLHNLPGKFSSDQIRASVVQEIITTEQDFVKHLKDVVDGYLRQVRRRPDMFTEDCIATIFGNIESIYNFQSQFLKHLLICFDADKPYLSQIGNCFLEHKQQFNMYSEYCNNHPLAVSKLQELYADPKYLHFFEACRLLQEMIDISLDGFLLTPIQRICKYPLQLAELLKYTSSDHTDYKPVTDAFAAMQEVAHMVNERKRRMECLEQLAELQQNIEGWEGPELLDTSTMLIHSGEVTRISSSWSRDVYVFLFDNLLVYCKKDLLKRNMYVYKGRLNLNSCQLVEIEDGRDVHFNMTVRNAWKLYCSPRKKWFLFYTKTSAEKSKWIKAFKEERKIVKDDDSQGFVVTQQDKKIARATVTNKIKPRRSRVKVYKKNAYPDISPLHLSAAARTGSLPSNFQPDFVALSGRSRKLRKKESSWFHFGSGKKRKK